MVRQEGLEPSTAGLEIRCSIQLSYWRLNFKKNYINIRMNINIILDIYIRIGINFQTKILLIP